MDPFPGYLDAERLTGFESVCEPAQLRDDIGRRVDALDITGLLRH
jgi:hypothetical protein